MGCNSSQNVVIRERFHSQADLQRLEGHENKLELLAPNARKKKLLDPTWSWDTEGISNGTAAKPEISVPSDLIIFVSPDDAVDHEAQDLVIANLDSEPVFFKVKVTHPKLLTFVPMAGRILPSNSVSVVVRLRKKETMESVPTNVKAMIQTVKAEYSEGDRLPKAAWNDAPEEIHRKDRVKITFTQSTEGENLLTKFVNGKEGGWWKNNWNHK